MGIIKVLLSSLSRTYYTLVATRFPTRSSRVHLSTLWFSWSCRPPLVRRVVSRSSRVDASTNILRLVCVLAAPRGPAREAPSSPTSPMAYKTTSRHLHHRTLSTSTRIPLLSGPPTTPPRRGANHLVSIPETPTTRRARKQLNRTQGKAKEWLEENLGRGFTMRRLVLLALVAIALLALAVDALTRGGRLGRFATSGLMTEAEQEMVVSAGNTVNGGASGAAPAARPLPSHKAPAPPPPPEPKLLPPPEIEQVQPPPPPPPAPVAVEEEPQRAPPPARLPLDEDSPRPAPVLEKPAPPKQQKPTIVKVPGPPPPVEVVAEKKEEAVAPPSQKFILTAWMGEQVRRLEVGTQKLYH